MKMEEIEEDRRGWKKKFIFIIK